MLLLAFLLLRRKYGPDMWKLLYARIFMRNRSEEERRSQGPDPATRRNETHQAWYGEETSSRRNEESRKTVLGNILGFLKRLFGSSDTETNDPSVDQNAIPLENQAERNSSQRSALGTWNSTESSSFGTMPNITPRGSPAIIPQPHENSPTGTIPSYYIQYRDRFLSHPGTPEQLSTPYRTDTSSTRDSDQSRMRNIGSWAHYQRQRQEQRRKSKQPPVQPINEHNAARFSEPGPSGNRRSTRVRKHRHRRSSASTLSVFRQHPGQEVDITLAPKRKRIRRSVLSRLMPS